VIARFRAFLRRDLMAATSYKVAFSYQVLSLFSTILTVYFLARMVSQSRLPSLEPYGGDYFSFALIGAAFADYMAVTLHEFSRTIRIAQTVGTLEAMLATPTQPGVVVIGSALYRFIWSWFRVAIYIASGLLLGAEFPDVNLVAALVTAVLSMLAFGSVGVLGAAVVLILKAWNPITALFSGLSFLLGGVLYPVSTLPVAAQWIAAALPITHALEAMRGALLMGRSVADLAYPLLILAGFTIIVLPLALWAFGRALRFMRVEGSLAHY
jgi:ABC-2 type transport system permease protein